MLMPIRRFLYRCWKWVVSAVAVIGVGAWIAVKWLAAGAASKTGAVATVAALTTAFSFSFADKGSWKELHTHAKHAVALANDGEPEKAKTYLDQIDQAIQKKLSELDAPTSTDNPTDPSEKSMEQVRAAAAFAALVRANLKFRELQDEQKLLSQYAQELNSIPDSSGSVVSKLIALDDGALTTSRLITLYENDDTHSDARNAVLGAVLSRTDGDRSLDGAKDRLSTYERLLPTAYELHNGRMLLAAYIKDMDDIGKTQEADQFLNALCSLSYDGLIGVAAAELVIGRTNSQEDRPVRIIQLVETYPNSAISQALHAKYIDALIRQNRLDDAVLKLGLNIAEEQSDAREAALTLMSRIKNINQVVQTSKNQPVDSTIQYAAFLDQSLSASHLAARLAEGLMDNSRPALAAELAFAALQEAKQVPANLLTGRALRNPTELTTTNKTDELEATALYLIAALYAADTQTDRAFAILEPLASTAPEGFLRAHILAHAAEIHFQSRDFRSASDAIGKAVETFPDSLLLIDRKNEILKQVQRAGVIARLEIQVASLREQISATDSEDKIIEILQRISDLYLAGGFTEQAVGALVEITDRFPKHDQAPQALADAVRILEDSNAAGRLTRIAALRERLADKYSDFQLK